MTSFSKLVFNSAKSLDVHALLRFACALLHNFGILLPLIFLCYGIFMVWQIKDDDDGDSFHVSL